MGSFTWLMSKGCYWGLGQKMKAATGDLDRRCSYRESYGVLLSDYLAADALKDINVLLLRGLYYTVSGIIDVGFPLSPDSSLHQLLAVGADA
ncbi:hypothetical protein SAY87_006918 [Trapa incisa]|uniref:Uncharacterized protein n=1 Tax=Trapa incisa TaxID=236973 RepID=A0AAN7JZG2_9MYRT|nr:hypothetical protein SAY87_006918 [Trapa incisa]